MVIATLRERALALSGRRPTSRYRRAVLAPLAGYLLAIWLIRLEL